MAGASTSDFAGSHFIYGCYAYKNGPYNGRMFYGTGGNLEQMKEAPWNQDVYRPKGYDCLMNSNKAHNLMPNIHFSVGNNDQKISLENIHRLP